MWNAIKAGVRSLIAPAPPVKNLEKAIDTEMSSKSAPENKSHIVHPYNVFMGTEWLYRQNSVLTFEDLRAMSKNPIIGAIIQTRLNQVAMFCRPAVDYEYGFKIVKDGSEKMTDDDIKIADEITKFIDNAGIDGLGEPSFETLIRKVLRDSLVLDQLCIEIVRQRNGIPAYLVAVDGATIRNLKDGVSPHYEQGESAYAQVVDATIQHTYTKDQLIYGIRNPITTLLHNGYGFSELEYLITTVTTLLNAEKTNALSLEQGGTQRGVLHVQSDNLSTDQMEAFSLQYKKAVKNAALQWEPPVLFTETAAKLELVTLDRSSKDIEYAQLYEYIVKLATAVYQINPEEVNWVIGTSGASTSFNSGAKDRLKFSEDKGLRPLLKFIANLITKKVVKSIHPDFSLEFSGLGRSLTEEIDLRVKEVTHYKTINEVRLDQGLEPLEDGDRILNSITTGGPVQPLEEDNEMEIDNEDEINDIEKTLTNYDWY